MEHNDKPMSPPDGPTGTDGGDRSKTAIPQAHRPRVSVVIPTLNETTTIAESVGRVQAQRAEEIVVVDAANQDGTTEIASQASARVLISPQKRAVQQNLGTSETS